MWDRSFTWKGWDLWGVVLWIALSVLLGILFHKTITLLYEWWTSRRR